MKTFYNNIRPRRTFLSNDVFLGETPRCQVRRVGRGVFLLARPYSVDGLSGQPRGAISLRPLWLARFRHNFQPFESFGNRTESGVFVLRAPATVDSRRVPEQ